MIKKTYRLQLASPAFLGDADQKGTWRTPPLKALIREWWRIAVAPQVAYEVGALKTQEKALFGTAADDGSDGNQQSKIRLALSDWRAGSCKQWEPGEARVTHPEVKDRNTGKERPVGPELYLGYGPLVFQQGTQLNNGAALQAKEENTLKLAHAEEHDEALTLALTLAHWFGTIGGRSRNGWGSLGWEALADTPTLPVLSKAALEHTGCSRPLARCLDLDWPHAIGTDAKGALVWRSKDTFRDWRAAMKFLAQTKIGFRTQEALQFRHGGPHPNAKKRQNGWQLHDSPEPRHVLAYPVTHHEVSPQLRRNGGGEADWGQDARLANTLRFKLQREPDGSLRALIYHTPCKPTLPHQGIDLLDTWQRVHRHLDNAALTRLP